jgi:hypothetical protein
MTSQSPLGILGGLSMVVLQYNPWDSRPWLVRLKSDCRLFNHSVWTFPCTDERSLTDLGRVIPIKRRPGYDPPRICIIGTGVKVLRFTDEWALKPDSSGRFLWLPGLACAGKTACASAGLGLAEHVDGRHCFDVQLLLAWWQASPWHSTHP